MEISQLPLNALRAFEASARHASFTRAGLELRVTQTAISHQVKALEDVLRANPAKVVDFGDKDLLQGNNLARILFGEVIPLRRDAR